MPSLGAMHQLVSDVTKGEIFTPNLFSVHRDARHPLGRKRKRKGFWGDYLLVQKNSFFSWPYFKRFLDLLEGVMIKSK